jgi:hypothetical protein
VPEVTSLAQTIEAWWSQILAFICTGITNAATEAHQPAHQRRYPHRLRLSQPAKPTAQSTVAL